MGRRVESYFGTDSFLEAVPEARLQHSMQRDGKLIARNGHSHQRIGLIYTGRAINFQPSTHDRLSLTARQAHYKHALRSVRIDHYSQHPRVVKHSRILARRDRKDASTWEAIARPDKQQRVRIKLDEKTSKKYLLPPESTMLQLEDPFLERFFMKDGYALRQTAAYLTEENLQDVQVYFPTGSVRFSQPHQNPEYRMDRLRSSDYYRSAGLKTGQIKDMYDRRCNLDYYSVNPSDLTMCFAEVRTQSGQVVLRASYTPPGVSDQFNPIIPTSMTEAPNSKVVSKGIKLPFGEIVLDWTGIKKVAKKDRTDFRKVLYSFLDQATVEERNSQGRTASHVRKQMHVYVNSRNVHHN